MTAQTAQVDDLQLVALPTAVSCAAMFVQFALGEWSLEAIETVAVQAARSMAAASVEAADPRVPGPLTVRVALRGEFLAVEVQDGASPRATGPRLPAGVHDGGVGSARGGGRVMWCEVALPEHMAAASVPLPQRERRPSPAAAALGDEPAVDPELMERILHGLSRSRHGRQD